MFHTYLSSLGCSCTTVQSAEDIVSSVADGKLDAVLMDLRFSRVPQERLACIIEKIPPSLMKHTLVITRDAFDAKTNELLVQRSLHTLPQGRLVQGMWEILQRIFAAPWFEGSVLRGMRVAQMIFDSFHTPLPAGVRGSFGFSRHLSSWLENIIVDVSIELLAGSGRISLAGQFTDYATGEGPRENFPVAVNGAAGPLARARTNGFGEFKLQFDSVKDLELEIWAARGSWLAVPMPEMNWPSSSVSSWGATG